MNKIEIRIYFLLIRINSIIIILKRRIAKPDLKERAFDSEPNFEFYSERNTV